MTSQNGLAAAIDKALAPRSQMSPFWEKREGQPQAPVLTRSQQQAIAIMQQAAILVQFRQYPMALPMVQQALSSWPTNADIIFQLGGILLELGQPAEALKRFDQAVGLRPNWSDAHNNRSAALARMGDVDGAVAAAERAVECAPNVAAYANLCAAYSSKGDNEKAIAYGEQAIQTSQGTNAMALINYGVAKRAVWDLEEAAGAQERAIDISSSQPGGQDYMAFANLGAIRNLQGRNHEALAVTQRAAELAPQNPSVRSNMVMYTDLLPETSLIDALCMRRTWAHLYEGPLKRGWRPHQNDRDPNRRLRVGYVGADFRQHSAAHIHGAVIRAHDPAQIAVYVYAGNAYEDEITAKIKEGPAIEQWLMTARMADLELAERIYRDQVDILIDVAGFTSGGRLVTFACKPAPIQGSAWGYANGTGLDAMDVFLADEVIVPSELEHGYHEAVIRMSSLLTFDPFLDLPLPGPPPKLQNGYVTLGSYNRIEKISDPILRIWCEVMRSIPDSRMILKFGGLTTEDGQETETSGRLKDSFERLGVERGRIETRGHTPRSEHIRQYGDIDLMLDSWPHVGGITTLEAAYSGVPCVTLLGPRAPSRVSASILHSLGMDDFVAVTPEQYVEIVKAKASADLSELRANLPNRVRSTTVGDPVRYTRELEDVYRNLWKAWISQVAGVGESVV